MNDRRCDDPSSGVDDQRRDGPYRRGVDGRRRDDPTVAWTTDDVTTRVEAWATDGVVTRVCGAHVTGGVTHVDER